VSLAEVDFRFIRALLAPDMTRTGRASGTEYLDAAVGPKKMSGDFKLDAENLLRRVYSMKTVQNTVRTLAAALAILVLSAGGILAQEPPKPGPEHEKLKQMAGEFDAKARLHIPGQPVQESKGDYKAKMDVGGLFLVSEYKGEMFGQVFQGRGLTGYDTYKKKYTGVWVDTMSPSIYTNEGAFDKSGKIFSETIEGPDPATGKSMKMRMTTEIKDKDHMEIKMYGPGEDGKEFMMMEIAYTRKK
jgi:hypothetical protein